MSIFCPPPPPPPPVSLQSLEADSSHTVVLKTQGRRKLFHSGGAALKGQHLCILVAKRGTWVNILKISSILTTDAEIHHFIHATEANKMADLTAIVSFGQNQK